MTTISNFAALQSMPELPDKTAARNAPESQAQREELAGQFEGMFVSMLMKEMRSTLDGGLFGEENSDTYGALFDMYLGQHLADSNVIGIRDLLMNQWKRQETLQVSHPW